MAQHSIFIPDYYSEWGDFTVGQVNDHNDGSSAYWDIYWLDTDSGLSLNDFDACTIIHEIGHALGLSHPYEDPLNGNWNTDDTVMSYNVSPDGWDTWFSTTDIAALIEIWGAENDPILGTDAFNYWFYRHVVSETIGGASEMIHCVVTEAVITSLVATEMT